MAYAAVGAYESMGQIIQSDAIEAVQRVERRQIQNQLAAREATWPVIDVYPQGLTPDEMSCIEDGRHAYPRHIGLLACD